MTAWLFKVLPSDTFVPEGTSLNRTSTITDKVSAAIKENVPGIKDVISVAGFNILSNGTKSSAATFFISMHPWAERKDFEQSVTAAIENVFMVGNGVVPEAFVIGANPTALPRLVQVGGLTMQLIDLESHSDEDLSDITDKIVTAVNTRPELQGVARRKSCRRLQRVTSKFRRYGS